MSKPFDYSKWDNIELSDDEEDCHPNIEKVNNPKGILRSLLNFSKLDEASPFLNFSSFDAFKPDYFHIN